MPGKQILKKTENFFLYIYNYTVDEKYNNIYFQSYLFNGVFMQNSRELTFLSPYYFLPCYQQPLHACKKYVLKARFLLV
jgi:hypothetical protein